MDLEDGMGGKTMAVNTTLLPSIFRTKVDHPSYKTWKELSEFQKEDWKKFKCHFYAFQK